MILLYALLLLIFMYFSLIKKKDFLKYCLFNRQGYDALKKTILTYGYQYSIKTHLLSILAIVFIITITCIQFDVRFESCLILIFVSTLIFPQIIIWILYHSYQEKTFNNFTMFLQTFISVFKINPKTYPTLLECRKVCEGEIVELIQEIQLAMFEKGSIEECLQPLLDYQPHFIVHNLISLVTTIENHGGVQYLEGLDLIQDDIDDWIEDTYMYKKSQIASKNRILILCGMSLIIAFFAKNMLQEIAFNTDSVVYQGAILFFLGTILFTIYLAHRILSQTWFEKEENIWQP